MMWHRRWVRTVGMVFAMGAVVACGAQSNARAGARDGSKPAAAGPAASRSHGRQVAEPKSDRRRKVNRIDDARRARSLRDVQLTTQLDRDAVLVGGDGRVHVQLTLSARDDGETQAQPVDVFVVLDTSGSMSGDKIASAKHALHALIDRLSTRDRFGLVSFDSNAELHVELARAKSGARREWHRVVDGLSAGGGTNMTAGLRRALSELPELPGERSARVLLLSDGHVNGGWSAVPGLTQDVRAMVRREQVVTTMGIGDHFNEDLMTQLADVGAGRFYYLQKIDMIARFLDAEFRAAAQTVASAVKLHFKPAQGIVVESISGYPMDKKRGAVIVRPGSLYAGQRVTLWATLKVPTDHARSRLALGEFDLKYKQEGMPQRVGARELPDIACVESKDVFHGAIHKKVWERVIESEYHTRAQRALAKAIESGTAADVDAEMARHKPERLLAESLGSNRVIAGLDALRGEAKEAKVTQRAPAAQRRARAKRKKATSYFKQRSSNYNKSDDPLAGLEGK